MRQHLSDVALSPIRAPEMGENQVNEQYHADEITTGQNHRPVAVIDEGLNDDPALEINFLRVPRSFMDLRQRSQEHEQNPEPQQHHGKPQRRKKLQNT